MLKVTSSQVLKATTEDCRGTFENPTDVTTTVPGHKNWYQASDGKADDQPRNKKFSHGFGTRYEFPLPEVKNAPVPSTADYSQENVAWLIEFFANMFSNKTYTELALRYENNTPTDCSDDIVVKHPQDKLYLPEASKCRSKSKALKEYEKRAKKSKVLKLYEKHSPANIDYFNPLC